MFSFLNKVEMQEVFSKVKIGRVLTIDLAIKIIMMMMQVNYG
jgi:hypothetical protein